MLAVCQAAEVDGGRNGCIGGGKSRPVKGIAVGNHIGSANGYGERAGRQKTGRDSLQFRHGVTRSELVGPDVHNNGSVTVAVRYPRHPPEVRCRQ